MNRKIDGGLRGGEDAAQLVLEQQPENAGRDRADDEQPAELRVGVVGRDPAIAQRPSEPPEDPHPVAPEEEEQHDRRRKMRRDEEREEELVVLMDVPADEPREDDAVAEARDGEELGHALQQPEHRRLEVADRVHSGAAGRVRFGRRC